MFCHLKKTFCLTMDCLYFKKWFILDLENPFLIYLQGRLLITHVLRCQIQNDIFVRRVFKCHFNVPTHKLFLRMKILIEIFYS